jgi:A/G-specific adenine glycosylase
MKNVAATPMPQRGLTRAAAEPNPRTITAGASAMRLGDVVPPPQEIARLDVEALAEFFARHGRDLPWRRPEASAWAVLVSEVMLQQTPVARVTPVYTDWMRRWPTPAALAAAPPGDAVRAWGRLGYPRRALRLHEAARAIVQRYGGAVPRDLHALLALPGIGDYTARAVAAFAFGERQPVVDTNVRRVISRAVRGIDEHLPASAADRAELESLLPVDPTLAVITCAALMEVGALRCTATAPDCVHCPLARTCAWRAAGFPPGPERRRPAQRWHGTDRQVRGEIMAVLRAAAGPVGPTRLRAGTASYTKSPDQWERCLASLVSDGLAVRDRRGRFALP